MHIGVLSSARRAFPEKSVASVAGFIRYPKAARTARCHECRRCDSFCCFVIFSVALHICFFPLTNMRDNVVAFELHNHWRVVCRRLEAVRRGGGMQSTSMEIDAKVAVLVDCENADPDILDYALRVAAQFGRVVLRRGFGSHAALANKWQTVLVQQAFTPCLQYAYAPGKNTSDIALAMDAIEALFDQRASTFCLVTSDSDFAGLCRKLRERGATVHVIGETKTPEALRNASDQFFQWTPPEPAGALQAAPQATKSAAAPKPKQRPKSIVTAVKLLAADSPDGRIHVATLGSYLRRTDPSFSPQTYGHAGLVNMLKTYDLLDLRQESGGHWTAALAAPPAEVATAADRQA